MKKHVPQNILLLKQAWLLLGCFILMSGCGESQPETELPQLAFQVDSTLLDICYTDTATLFSVYFPKGWELLPDSIFNSAKEKLEAGLSPMAELRYELIHLYQDSTRLNFCSLAEIPNGGNVDFNDMLQSGAYENWLSERFPGTDIQKAKFRIHLFEVNQFMMVNDERVRFKLFFQPSVISFFELDYTIARANYPTLIRAIESSIGSLQKLNTTEKESLK